MKYQLQILNATAKIQKQLHLQGIRLTRSLVVMAFTRKRIDDATTIISQLAMRLEHIFEDIGCVGNGIKEKMKERAL